MKKAIIVFILGMPFLSNSQTIQNVNKTNGTSPSNNISTIDSIIFPAGGGQMQINLNNATPVIHQIQDIVNVNFSIGGVYPAGTVFCNVTPTVIVDVTNPTTGEIWMDRNLGATQAATSSTDANSYGDLYQWGRRSDGHQCRTSATTTTLSSTDQPANGSFILAPSFPNDWRSPQNNNLWQGVNGINGPCPIGYRLPTEAELEAERLSWSSIDDQGAFASPLKLPMAGFRLFSNGLLFDVGTGGRYWSSSVSSTLSRNLVFNSSNANMGTFNRADGLSVRCLKDTSSPQGSINTIDCGSATNNGTLTSGTAASGVSSLVTYSGGNGGTHSGQTVTSTGVTGLTATLNAGTFANGAGSLTYTITGTPSASGTASFALSIGGQSCNLNLTVNNAGGSGTYPPNSVFCSGIPTVIIDVTNPITGEIWMDRNLGATQVATSSTDANAYGDLYQWGRRSDGHQCRTSATTTTLSSTDQPANGNFILVDNSPDDWRSPQNNNLWQGVNGVNNPCPSGYRLPTEAELETERLSWSSNNAQGAFASALKLPVAGYRDYIYGSLDVVGTFGYYWSSSVSSTDSRNLFLGSSIALMGGDSRASGHSVRCLKDVTSPQGSINYIDCGSATNNGTLTSGAAANGVSSLLPYTGGNGGTHNGQTVTSTGVTGLTATLAAGTFANGTGSLTYTITGTPSASGTASFALNIGGQSCTLTRTVGLPAVSITGLNCASATNNGTLTSGTAASGVNSVVPYTGGNGVTHNGQTVTSTGVTGLTATLAAGTFANGTGSLTYTITGTPSSSSTASFVLSIGGQSCTLSINVLTASSPAYSPNSVFCANGPTSVVDVTNPATGEIWMDRNLGATQAATSSNDTNSYGDLYQWGRRSDGHQCRTSPTTSILSSTDQPGHGDFISVPVGIPYDWRSPQNNNLWQYVNGINNPCPSGYRLPTEAELETERLSWSSNNAQGAFASALKLPLAGGRDSTGSLNNVGNWGIYWSSTVINAYSQFLFFNSSWAFLNAGLARASGLSVRCLKDVSSPQGSINTINCGSATNNGTLTSGTAASWVSSIVPYTGGNGGTHNGQTVASTGVTGLTATLAAGTFANGAGSLTYTISGTPSASGTASFALNIGGQSCTLTRTIDLPVGSLVALNCASATNNGTLTSGTAASGVSSLVPYTGGNGGTHNGQTVTSTGVTGLTATLAGGAFANGTGSVTYTISGTPSASGTASFALSIGGQSCTLTRSVGLPAGSITALNCSSATNNGTLTSGTVASGVSSFVPYTGGNGGTHNGQTVTSTGVTGLTATLAAGAFANGTGSVTYTISGTPSASGTASFALSIGGQSCNLNLTVNNAGGSGTYPPNSVFCSGIPTVIVDVTNPATGRIWMDRNLGATHAATSSTDANAYGDLYQWGRRSDGHQCRTSATTTTLSSTDQPANATFILAPNSPEDWRSPQNDNLWQGVNGVNNPCPSGYRLPTEAELETERLSWSSNNAQGAFASALKLPVAGFRFYSFGGLFDVGAAGYYWSSSVNGVFSQGLLFSSGTAGDYYDFRATGLPVRCLKD